MQGGSVQLTRSTDRTDLYLTVGPEPLDPDDERPYPTSEARAPEELLARVLSRDGSKTLATDTPDLPDVRRLSTRELRAERDRLAELRAECPPDRSRELRLAAQRAAEAEQARQQALKDEQEAAEQVAALAGSWRRRRDWQAAWAALERLADHRRGRDVRHRPLERAAHLQTRTWAVRSATAASWQEGAAHAPAL
jgi:hypothetical protein